MLGTCYENSCSDLCLLTSEETESGPIAKAACACPHDAYTSLSADGVTCRDTTILASNILRNEENNLFIVGRVDTAKPKITRIELPEVNSISCMTYNPITGEKCFHIFMF